MPDLTPNYQLAKPLDTEFYDIQVQNENMNKLDAALAGIDASLSNKVNLIGDEIISGLKTLDKGMLRIGSAEGIFTIYNFRGMIYRGSNSTIEKYPPESDFSAIATATPPVEYDLPLAAGWGIKNFAKYWKNQFGEVSLTFRVGRASGITSQGTVATLPEGYRPAYPVHAAATSYPTLSTGLLVVGSDGSVMVFSNASEASAEGSFCGAISFVATH